MEQKKDSQPENKNCFNTHDWYQDSCDNLKAMHLTLKQTSCIPFDIHIDSAASLRTFTKDDFRKKAFSVGLTSYDLLDDEMASQLTKIKFEKKYNKNISVAFDGMGKFGELLATIIFPESIGSASKGGCAFDNHCCITGNKREIL